MPPFGLGSLTLTRRPSENPPRNDEKLTCHPACRIDHRIVGFHVKVDSLPFTKPCHPELVSGSHKIVGLHPTYSRLTPSPLVEEGKRMNLQ